MRTADDIRQDTWQEEDSDEMPAVTPSVLDLDRQLRIELGRRLTLALIAPPGGPDEAVAGLHARLAAYPDVLAVVVSPASTKRDEAERVMADAARLDPDAVLVALASGSPTVQVADSAAVPAIKWPRDLLDVADRMGVRDRAFFALVGDPMTRETARRMRYEDGFSVHAPAHDLIAVLAREALAREEARRRGSSPPCYL